MELEKDWQGKTRGNFGIKLLLKFFKIFPLTFGYFILWFVIPFYLVFARKGYNSIYYYFRHRLNLSPLKSFFKTFRNHYIFGQVMLDRIAVFAGRKNIFKVNVYGEKILNNLIKAGKGGIIVSPHIGNFEISGYLFNMGNSKMHGLAYGQDSENWLKYRNIELNQNNISLIPVAADLSHIFTIKNAINKGELVGIPGDRSFHGTRVKNCMFLGKEAKFPTGAFNIAEKLNIPVVSFFVIKSKKFCYDIFINKIEGGTVNKQVDCFVAQIGKMLGQYPEQWFNFYDFWNDMKHA